VTDSVPALVACSAELLLPHWLWSCSLTLRECTATPPANSKCADARTPALQVVEDFGLLRFMPLHVEDKHAMAALLRNIDKANGYAFTGRPDAQAILPDSIAATGALCINRVFPCHRWIVMGQRGIAWALCLAHHRYAFLHMQTMGMQTWQPTLRSASSLRML
jgi:hypothetical protein